MIKNTLPNKWGNHESLKMIATIWKLFNYCARSWQEFAERVLQVVLFAILWLKWSVKKNLCSKKFTKHENNRNYNSYRFSFRFAFILFLSFLTNQKQKLGFQQVGDLVTRNISVFLYSESHSSSKLCWIQ